MRSPSEDAPRKPKPVREQLLQHLEGTRTVFSLAGQTFTLLDCPGAVNAFAVSTRSPHLRAFLVERQTARQNPPPSESALRETARNLEARPYAGSMAYAPTRIDLRLAWRPDYTEPVVLEDGSQDYPLHQSQPAIVLALDARRGYHAVVTSGSWSLHRTRTLFLVDPVQRALPDPVQPAAPGPETALEPFRQLLRLPSGGPSWPILLAWILAALRPPKDPAFHSYPILNLIGPASSGKSVAAKLLTRLLDPTGTPLHSLPSTERRLHAIAATRHILAFDDPGKINPEKSRFLSRLAGGVASLHPALQGILVRPLVLTTREEKETRHLSTRIVDVEFPPLEFPLPEEEILRQFDRMQPAILGALLSLLARDFDAPSPHLPNRKSKLEKIDVSVTAVVRENGGAWEGTVTELLHRTGLPTNTNALGRVLADLPSLTLEKNKTRQARIVHLTLAYCPKNQVFAVGSVLKNSIIRPATFNLPEADGCVPS
jgi:hypothetical protein